MNATERNRLITLAVLLVATVITWFPAGLSLQTPVCETAKLCVAFLDVGQGDAIFIESPSGTQLLIDAGRNSGILRELSSVMGAFDRELDYVLMTHPDLDHIGGFVDIFERYAITQVIRTENESDTPAWKTVEQAITSEGATVSFARRGQLYDLGGGVALEILFPETDMTETESNTASIVAKLTYGETSFLLTGDSPKNIEEYLVLTHGEFLQSTVLKVGHHGSRTSTSELFLDEVSPTYAVVSAGKDNQYGHPHVEVTDMLFNKRVQTLSTAEEGTIVFQSDGHVVQVQ